jgi:hypothetical protein
MTKSYYLPRADEEKATWLNNFAGKLPTFSAKYGITGEELMDMQQSAAYFDALIKYRNQFNTFQSAITDHKKAVRDGLKNGNMLQPLMPPSIMLPPAVAPGIFGRATALANRIKAQVHYTTADGNDLGIEGTEVILDTTLAKPQLKIRLVEGGHPEIVWMKQGMDALEIHKEEQEGNWQFLAIDLQPNYVDTAFLPSIGKSAVWRYRAIYRFKDKRVGHWSDVVSVTVAG